MDSASNAVKMAMVYCGLILPLRAVFPLSCVVIAMMAYEAVEVISIRRLLFGGLQLWLVAEFLFFFYYLFTKQRLEQRIFLRKPEAGVSRQVLERCLEAMIDPNKSEEDIQRRKKEAVQGWFRKEGAEVENVKVCKENVREWIAWAFFECHQQELNDREVDEAEGMIQLVEDWLNESFEEGYNPDALSMRLNLDPINSLHRPLAYYAVTAFAFDLILRTMLARNGFRLCKSGASLSYWYREGSGEQSDMLPVVFCHGLGVGVLPYIQFIKDLVNVCPGRQVFLINLPNISMQPNTYVHSSQSLVHDICKMLEAWSVESAHFIGHSFGSCVMSFVLKSPQGSKYVGAATFIDPVTFLLCKPDVAYNFVYRKPTTATQLLIKFFISQELYIAHSLGRHFFWKECVLWEEQLISPTHIILSKLDSIVPSPSVHDYLKKVQPRVPNLKEVLMFDDIGHAESFLVNSKRRIEILQSVLRLDRATATVART